ncbi:transposase [Paenibacillus lactis]|uniref:transposase n=1 Tax=Paenibacillus lactis TaxID=228574 RepID=UPI001BCDFE8A
MQKKEKKLKAVLRYSESSESLKSIVRSLGIEHSIFLNWTRQYEHHGEING